MSGKSPPFTGTFAVSGVLIGGAPRVAPPVVCEPQRTLPSKASDRGCLLPHQSPEGIGRFCGTVGYATYLAMSTSGGVGYSIYSVSILWLAYQISGNLVVAGAVLFVELATYSLTFVIGPLVDRAADKRTIFLACFPVQAAAAGALALGLSRGFLTIPLLLGLVVVISLLWDFAWAAGNTATRLLLSPDEMFAAQGLSGLVNGGNTISGSRGGRNAHSSRGCRRWPSPLCRVVGCGRRSAILGTSSRGSDRAFLLRAEFSRRLEDGLRGEGRPLLLLSLMDGVRGFVSNGPALLITLAANVIFRDPAQAYGVLFTVYIVGGVASGLIWGHINPRHRVGPLLCTFSRGDGDRGRVGRSVGSALGRHAASLVLGGVRDRCLHRGQVRLPRGIVARGPAGAGHIESLPVPRRDECHWGARDRSGRRDVDSSRSGRSGRRRVCRGRAPRRGLPGGLVDSATERSTESRGHRPFIPTLAGTR